MKNTITLLLTYVLFVPVTLYSQTENWVYTYNGPLDNDDEVNSIVYGQDGSIYVAGHTRGSDLNDFLVISLTTSGDTNWVYKYGQQGGGQDVALSITYGDDGNIYAAGYSAEANLIPHFLVISLTSLGDTNWIYKYQSPENSGAASVVYGLDGNIYAAGGIGDGFSRDMLIVSLTTSGDTNWTYKYGGIDFEQALTLAYGLDNCLYVGGCINRHFAVISLTTSGGLNWTYIDPGSGGSHCSVNSIVYGRDANIYAAGATLDNGTDFDFAVVSLSDTGDTNWTYKYAGPEVNTAYSIVYGEDGNIYAAGTIDNLETFMVISLTTAGDTNWIYGYTGSISDYDVANSVVYGADGNIYAAGYTTDNTTLSDFTVISLTSLGDTNWIYQYNGPGNRYDVARSIVYGGDGNLYVGGFTTGNATARDFTVISLGTTGQKEGQKSPKIKTQILKPTPNPFCSFTTIPGYEQEWFVLYDVVGKKISSCQGKQIGKYLAPGVYFLKPRTKDSKTQLHRVVKVR